MLLLGPWLTVAPWSTPPAPLVPDEALVDTARRTPHAAPSGSSSSFPA
ncbi:hypothetical protein [Sorangium sp. So ce1000]